MHFLEFGDGLKVLYFNFQVPSMSGSPSRRPLFTISRLDPWRSGGYLDIEGYCLDELRITRD